MLNGILDGMGKVIHGINAPLIAGVMMRHAGHTVNHRVSHVDVGRCHVDFCTQHLLTVLVKTVLHIFKQRQIFLHGTIPVRAVLSGRIEVSPVFPDLLRRQITDIGLSFFDQLHRAFVHGVKIIGSKEQPVLEVGSQPFYICNDGFHIFGFFLRGIGIVKTEVEFSSILLCKTIVQKNGLGMSDMKIAVGLRREPGLDVVIYSLRQILVDFLFDEISGNHFLCFLCRFFVLRHNDSSIYFREQCSRRMCLHIHPASSA